MQFLRLIHCPTISERLQADMPKLKLRPWKFPKGQKVILYWLCSPFRQADGSWVIQAAFLPPNSADFEVYEYPWGTLPALNVGWYYVDGLPAGPTPDILNQNIFVHKLNEGKIQNAFAISNELYDFWRRQEFGTEKVWQFRVNGGLYFLPCLEMLRAFLLPSKMLTNLVLRPNGLESLIEGEKREGNTLEINLSAEIPRTIVTHQNVAHLVWLLYNEKIRNYWHSVYRNLFAQAIEESAFNPVQAMSKGLPIAVEPPALEFCSVSIDVVAHNCSHLITRIKGFSLTDFPFKRVIYSHPSIKERKSFESKDKKRRIVPENNEDFQLDAHGRQAKQNSHQPLVEVTTTYFNFRTEPRMIRFPQGESLIPIKSTEEVSGTQPGNIIKGSDQIVSTDEPIRGGQIQPIEFAGLEVSLNLEKTGFDSFFDAIVLLKTQQPHLIFEFTIIDVAGDKAFCTINGARRRCTVVEVSQAEIPPCYIFEIARPDSWSISTLFVRFRPKENEIIELKQKIPQVLSNAVDENGHWGMERFNHDSSVTVALLKHTPNKDPINWSRRIMEKLMAFGFPAQSKIKCV